MNKAYGVQVTAQRATGTEPRSQPLVVVARDERDAELVAARFGDGTAEAETLRELTADEVREYGLDLDVHGDARALPALNL